MLANSSKLCWRAWIHLSAFSGDKTYCHILLLSRDRLNTDRRTQPTSVLCPRLPLVIEFLIPNNAILVSNVERQILNMSHNMWRPLDHQQYSLILKDLPIFSSANDNVLIGAICPDVPMNDKKTRNIPPVWVHDTNLRFCEQEETM